jgi:tRNA threonylcarbamoyladenosine biosynthesis protein TsaE
MNIFESLKEGIHCKDAEATMAVGHALADSLPSNQVITLTGDLGAGKTTLTKGIGRALGMDPDHITSPTFNLYSIHQGSRQLIHIDAYRLHGSDAMDTLLIEEFLISPWLIVIEWPQNGISNWMKGVAIQLTLERLPAHGAVIRLINPDSPLRDPKLLR